MQVLLDHSCMLGTSLENTTSGGDEPIKKESENGKGGVMTIGLERASGKKGNIYREDGSQVEVKAW